MARHGWSTGWVRFGYIEPEGKVCWKPWRPNLRLAEGMTALAQLLRGSPDGRPYHLRTMYLEFENNNGAPVVPPSFGVADGRDYYDTLLTHSYRDYLRVPLTAVSLSSSNQNLYPKGNRLTCFAQTAGIVGVHGKPFHEAVESRVYGCALVATPADNDPTQDLVFARAYYPANDQVIKVAGKQIGVEWRIDLTV